MTHATSTRPLLVISDGTGDTAKKMLEAAMRQFDHDFSPIEFARHIHDFADLHAAFERAARQGSIVISTLVQPEMRAEAERLAQRHQLAHRDLLGGLLDTLTQALDQRPVGVPNLLHRTDDHYFRRVDAIEFTVAADDGRNPARVMAADLVLVGASRTGKTPLSTFLAHRGLKVANQPLWLDREPPKTLFRVDPHRVVCLTIDPDALVAIRVSRLSAQHLDTNGPYTDPQAIRAELEQVEGLAHGNGWQIMDVTNRAIEETATMIIEHLRGHGLLDHDARFL